ncbi:MAG: LytTR family DNA-binding domain-containing protein [Bacteroidota bacterium]
MRAIIIEDETRSRNSLKQLLKIYCPTVEVVGEAEGIDLGVAKTKELEPELVFLDIEVGPKTGFNFLEQFKNPGFDVIFTTAYDQYAMFAIKWSAIDYLLKPIGPEDLKEAVWKAEQRQRDKRKVERFEILLDQFKNPTHSERDKRIVLSTSEGLEFINVDEILYCQASGSYTDFMLTEDKKITVSRHLKEYEQLLEDYEFLRIHQSHLINGRKIKRFIKSGDYIEMLNGQKLHVASSKKNMLMEYFGR